MRIIHAFGQYIDLDSIASISDFILDTGWPRDGRERLAVADFGRGPSDPDNVYVCTLTQYLRNTPVTIVSTAPSHRNYPQEAQGYEGDPWSDENRRKMAELLRRVHDERLTVLKADYKRLVDAWTEYTNSKPTISQQMQGDHHGS